MFVLFYPAVHPLNEEIILNCGEWRYAKSYGVRMFNAPLKVWRTPCSIQDVVMPVTEVIRSVVGLNTSLVPGGDVRRDRIRKGRGTHPPKVDQNG